MPGLSFDDLSPTQFEEFVYDLLGEIGHKNVDWRKGTAKDASPADRGRDIQSHEPRLGLDGSQFMDKWFTDCKHHKSGVPPTELQNLLTWATAERADVALFACSGYLSNGAKDYIDAYERNMGPPFRIVVWELPKLEKLSEGRDDLLARHGLHISRKITQVMEMEAELADKAWFARQLNHLKLMLDDSDMPDLDEEVYATMEEMRERYGDESLEPMTDEELATINGKLSALRWVLGEDWNENAL